MEGTGYKFEGQPLLLEAGQQWPACPPSFLSDPNFSAALTLYQSAKVSPLAEWPHRYSAWAHRLVCDIHDAFEALKLRAQQEG